MIRWKPGLYYDHRLVSRLVSAPQPTSNIFPRMDWRFKEFPNEGTHCLYGTCVELMTLPDWALPQSEGCEEEILTDLFRSVASYLIFWLHRQEPHRGLPAGKLLYNYIDIITLPVIPPVCRTRRSTWTRPAPAVWRLWPPPPSPST